MSVLEDYISMPRKNNERLQLTKSCLGILVQPHPVLRGRVSMQGSSSLHVPGNISSLHAEEKDILMDDHLLQLPCATSNFCCYVSPLLSDG